MVVFFQCQVLSNVCLCQSIPSKKRITQNSHDFNSLVWNFGSGTAKTAAVHSKRRTGEFTPPVFCSFALTSLSSVGLLIFKALAYFVGLLSVLGLLRSVSVTLSLLSVLCMLCIYFITCFFCSIFYVN